MKILIATIKSWNIKNALRFKQQWKNKHEVELITKMEDFTFENIAKFNPDYIFIPHWSWIIPQVIFNKFNCILFHMTDLPFGRGGSPLQNLIYRGIENTKISAIKVCEKLDAGDVYLKEELNLSGTAEEIFIRASQKVFNKMIPKIIEEQIVPIPQSGKIVEFNRRKPSESEITSGMTLENIYDYIRMLDGEGYPSAFIKFGKYKIKFSRASMKSNKILADVEIIEEGEYDE